MRRIIIIVIILSIASCSWITAEHSGVKPDKPSYRPAYWYEIKEGKQYWYPK